MTTSGTSTFNYNRDQIIRRSLRQVGAIAAGETPDAQAVTDAADALNAMIKEWDALGIHLWTEAEGVLFLQPGQSQYAVGAGSTDHATQTNPPNYVTTTLSANAIAGATSVSVSSISNILAGDNIGIATTAGNVFWTTVNGAPTGSNINLASPLTSAATALSNVYDYTTPILRPLRVAAARRFYTGNSIETPMIKMSRLDFRDLPNKVNTGIPTQFFYDPLGGAVTLGYIYVWPTPVDATNLMKFTWFRQIQDFNTASNTPDLPQEWVNCITWNLSLEIGPEYDVPPERYEMIKERAAVSLDRVMGWDREDSAVYFGVQLDEGPFQH